MSWIDDLPAEDADTLSDERKASPTLNKYSSLGEALNGLVNADERLGGSIRIPGEDAGPDDINAYNEKLINNAPDLMRKPDFSNPEQSDEFYQTLGKPKEMAGYTIPDEITLDKEIVDQIVQIGYDNNLIDSQVGGFLKALSSMNNQTAENNQVVQTQDMDDLAGKWGVTLEGRLASAKKMNEEFYPGINFDGLNSSELQAL
jgi:hypothetical protein